MKKWSRPSWEEELEAFKRVALDLQLPLDGLEASMRAGKLVRLDGFTWCRLENTYSNDTFNLIEAEKVAARFGKDLAPIVRAISGGVTMPAPIILDRAEEQRPYLVAGDVRLMACRGLNVTPMVWRIPE